MVEFIPTFLFVLCKSAYVNFTHKTNLIICILRLSKHAPFNFDGNLPAKLKKHAADPPLGLPFVTLLDPSGSPIETGPPKNRDLLGLNYLGLQNSTPPSLKSASAGIVKRKQFTENSRYIRTLCGNLI